MDCLVVGYAEPSRNRERQQFFNEKSNQGTGWRRYLHLNYIGFESDFVLPNHLASLADLKKQNGKVQKDENGGFLSKDINYHSTWNIPLLGGLYIYQHLKKNGHETALIKHVQLERERFEEILKEKPKVIAISTTLLLNPLDIGYVVSECRKLSPDSFIVLGGTTIWTDYLARNKDTNQYRMYLADAIVLDSKGFKTLEQVVSRVKNGKPVDSIPNLLLLDPNNRSKIHLQTPTRPEVFDFKTDTLDWDHVDDQYLGNITWMQTQVSCPFSCNFCSFPVIQGEVKKNDLESVKQSLDQLHQRGVRHLLFVDDTFNVPKTRFIEFLKLLKNYEFTWYSYIRCQFLDPAQVKLMKESGCGGVYLGIESAHEDVLTAMNKAVKPQKYWEGVKLLSDNGIPMYGSFIIGFPGETPESIELTTRFIQESGLDYYNIKCFYYDHATPIHNYAEKYNLKGTSFYWEHNSMNADQAFSAIQKIITETKVPYIPQHSGEIWEYGYFLSQGFDKDNIRKLYSLFTDLMQDEFAGKPHRYNDNEVFEKVGKLLSSK